MHLSAVVPRAELVALIESLTPFRLALGRSRARSLTVGRPRVTFLPGRGIRLNGNARLAWEVAGITVPVSLQGWQLLLVPRVRAASQPHRQLLGLEPVLEELGLRLVPAFVDDKIAETITDWVGRYEKRLAWNFARTLSRRLALPAAISPAESFDIHTLGGEVEVTADALRFEVRFEARIERATRPAVKRALPPGEGRTGSPGGTPAPARAAPHGSG